PWWAASPKHSWRMASVEIMHRQVYSREAPSHEAPNLGPPSDFDRDPGVGKIDDRPTLAGL
ncbi:MAG: hypothetical protein AAGF75_14185, partial [Cyanobacteria bacterium P01_H01_bin.130]